MQFIDDADSAHTESHFDSNPDTYGQSGTRPDAESFADATIANAVADTVAHAIANAVAFTDARDHLRHVGLRARPVDERYDCERTA